MSGVLVTGAGGMLGSAVVLAARARGLVVHAAPRSELDVTDPAAVSTLVAGVAPQVVYNCAAWTDVDGAERQPAAAAAVNADGAGNVARAAARAGALLVHVSTDYVFDGRAARPYVESDPVRPCTAYGSGKLDGERQVADASPRHAIVRTAWLFGTGGRNFVDTMLGLAADGREQVAVVTDQLGCPTWTGHLAPALLDVGERGLGGVVHAAAAGSATWNELAHEVFARAELAVEVLPSTTVEQARPAARPAFSVLASERDDAPRLPDWREGVREYLAARGSRGTSTGRAGAEARA